MTNAKMWPLALCLALAGCAGFGETIRGIEGNSTRVLYETRPQAAAKEFRCNPEDCRQKAGEILAEMKTYVYRREPGLIAVFVSETDTTPVGIFITPGEEESSRIEVSSPSSPARDAVSQKLFSALESRLKTKKIDVQLDTIEGKR
jgi:hypothetical protein